MRAKTDRSTTKMLRIIILVIAIAILLGGCAKPPREELQAARMAVARAYTASAEELAASEYQAAGEALREGERLVRQGNYQLAREVLPYAEALAHQAILRAKDEQINREQQQIQAQQQSGTGARQERKTPTTQSAPKAVNTPSPTPRLTPPVPSSPSASPPLRHFNVSVEESLWSIAARIEIYADPLLWPLIYKANRDQIKDPRRVYPGQTLSIPRDISDAELEDARQKARHSEIFPVEQSPPE